MLLLSSASFAWLSLSRVPEVTGIITHLSSNGSLEIALLTDETYMDPTCIKSDVGDSSVIQEATYSNLRCGNVIDLSSDSYGLNQISLYPARLQLMTGADSNHLVKPICS